MEQDAIQAVADSTVNATNTVPSSPVWDFINQNPWLVTAGLTAGGLAITIGLMIWSGAKFYIRAKDYKHKYKRAKDKYKAQKRESDEWRSRFEKTQETITKDGLIFLRHEATPKGPLCPVCYSEGKIMGIIHLITQLRFLAIFLNPQPFLADERIIGQIL